MELDKTSIEDFRCLTQKVVKQHYVPRHYLSAWGTPTRGNDSFLIWCKRSEWSEARNVEAMSVAQCKYMYAYPNLSAQEQRLLISFIKSKPEPMQGFLQTIYEYALSMPLYLRLLKGDRSDELWGRINELNSSCVCDQLVTRVLKLLASDPEMGGFDVKGAICDVEVICHNGFEHWMTTLESGFNPLLDKARAGDLSFFDDDPNSRCGLIYYFFVQMLRTKVYDKMVDASNWNKYPNLQKMLRHGTAFEVAYSNASDWKNFELRLIGNKSSLQFITGDQPLVNLDANDNSPHFDLYFPISPTQAMVFIEKGRFQSVYSWLEHITEREAHELNRRIAKVCIDTVCAESKSVLDIGRYK